MQRERWNRLADRFEDMVCDIAATDVRNVLPRLVSMVAPPRRRSVLVDLGCGVGSFLLQFGSRFGEIVGVDYSPRIVARARDRCVSLKHVRWMCRDIRRAGHIIGPRADLTVCLNVITSASAAHRQGQWLSLPAVTRPGGFVLVVVPSIESVSMVATIAGASSSALGKGKLDGLIRSGTDLQKYYSRTELRAAVAGQGLRILTIRRVSYPWTEEGLSRPRRAGVRDPWDWVCLAQRPRLHEGSNGGIQPPRRGRLRRDRRGRRAADA